ncbi:MAG: sulfite exporter TauE/SafE family protein [Nitrospinota bacterium]
MNIFDPNIALAGLAVGLLVGFTGMGGGAMMTPLLIFLFGVPPGTAVATDLFKAIITKGAGAVQHLRQGTADLKTTLLLAKGSLPGALLGGATLFWVGRQGSPQTVDTFVLPVLGFTLILAGGGILFGTRRLKVRFAEERGETPPWGKRVLLYGGGVVGFLVALTSVGAGSLGIALLGFARVVAGRKLVGTDLLHGLLLVAVATLAAHGWAGRIDYSLAVNILAGSIPGAIIGSRLSAKTPLAVLHPILALILMVTGLGFLL